MVLYHIWFNLHVFFLILIGWIFRGQLLLHQHLFAIRFEQDVKIVFEIDASFLWCGIDSRKNVRVNVLKYVFVLRQILLKHSKIFFSMIDKSTNYLKHTRMINISTVEINKLFFFADMSIKFWRNALSPEHIDHLILCFICNLFAQRKKDSDF